MYVIPMSLQCHVYMHTHIYCIDVLPIDGYQRLLIPPYIVLSLITILIDYILSIVIVDIGHRYTSKFRGQLH